LFNGCLVAFASQLVTTDIGNRFYTGHSC
jgi:hypothetical protein